MSAPLAITLGGALQRYPDGWRWSDGTPERRVRDMLLADVAPNFRCQGYGSGPDRRTCVEIPARWRTEERYWPSGRIDDQAALAIEALLRECGQRAAIYAEGLAEALDDHRLRIDGWIIDVAQWDAVMREPCGVWWDRAHEADILARARALGWEG